MLVYFFGVFRNSTISLELLLGLVDAGDIRKPYLHVVIRIDLRLAAGERHDAALGAAHAAEEEAPQGDEEEDGDDPAEHLADPPAGHLAAVRDAVFLELLDELRILDPDGGEGARLLLALGLQRPAHAVVGDADVLHLAGAHRGLELAVGERLARLHREEERLPEREQEQEAEHQPDGLAGAGLPGRRRSPLRRPRGFGGTLGVSSAMCDGPASAGLASIAPPRT